MVRWAFHIGIRDFCSALAALVGLEQNILPHRSLFQFICHLRPASWAVVQGRLSLNM
jgi:hypothetical protein